MAAFPRTLTLILTLAAAAPAMAQTTTAPQPADTTQTDTTPPAPAADTTAAPAATEPAPDGIGQPYVAEKFGDWDLRCIRTADGADPCQIYQLLKEKTSGNPVSEINIVNLPKGSKVVAGATVVTPLETLLLEQLTFTIDGGKPAVYPFSYCTQVGCVARLGFTQEEIDRLRKGKAATITVVPVANPDAKVSVEVSLSGITAALEAQQKSEEALATKAQAAPAEAAPAAAAPADAPAQQ